MKAIILAAGYAVRLYPLTLNTPKPLLALNKKPIVDYIINKIKKIKDIDEVIIISNDKFYKNFMKWEKKISAKNKIKIKILNDGTKNENDRLGAIGDLHFVIKKEKLKEDVLIIAGDNIFEFDMLKFYDYFKKNKNIIALKHVRNKKLLPRYGIVEIKKDGKVINFEEKPAKPKSNLASVCCYFFEKETLKYFDKYLKNKLNKDAPGNFIAWLQNEIPIYGFVFKDQWFDIGDMESYKKANKIYSRKIK